MTHKKILIIEDEESVYELLALLLGKKGCSVKGARTGGDGVKLAQSEKPDVVLIDAHLPDLDGMDILRRIRSFDDTAKIYLYSGLYSEELEEEAVAAGASGFIDKSLSVESIVSVIASGAVQ